MGRLADELRGLQLAFRIARWRPAWGRPSRSAFWADALFWLVTVAFWSMVVCRACGS